MGIHVRLSGIRFESDATERAFRESFRNGGRLGRWVLLGSVASLTLGAPLMGPLLLGSPHTAYQAQIDWMWLIVAPMIAFGFVTLLRREWYAWSTPAMFAMSAAGILYLSRLTLSLTAAGQPQPLTALTLFTLLFCVLSRARVLAGLTMVALTLTVGAVTVQWATVPFHARDIFVFLFMCFIGITATTSVEMTARRAWLAREALIWTATYDGLSGVLVRGAFEEHMERVLRQAARTQTSLCLLCLDIDHFKQVNDQYGHLAGDEVIRCVGEELRVACQRPLDIAGRMGGDEFLVAFYDVDREQAVVLVERLQTRLRRLQVRDDQLAAISVTVSIGVTACVPDEQTKLRDLVNQADHLMYQAKRQGRDQYCCSSVISPPHTPPSASDPRDDSEPGLRT